VGQTAANSMPATTDSEGGFCLYTHGATHLVVDVVTVQT
jgi:hypothetical protein